MAAPPLTRRHILFGAIGTAALGGGAYFGLTGNAPPLPQHGAATEAETDRWLAAVREHGQDGDWLAIRGYHPADHLVATTTFRKFSHAAILDHTQELVVEAVAPRVQVVPLRQFLAHSHRFDLIRPHRAGGATPEAGRAALARARSKVGQKYDFLGTIGLPSEQRSYCSELCAWASEIEVDRTGPQRVFHPADMRDHGEVIFESGPRKLALAKN